MTISPAEPSYYELFQTGHGRQELVAQVKFESDAMALLKSMLGGKRWVSIRIQKGELPTKAEKPT